MTHSLPPLPYATDSLEPFIDRQTMELHHAKHHAAYVSQLNAALERHPALQTLSVEALLRGIRSLPGQVRPAVRKYGGGHANHSLFWVTIGPPTGGPPAGAIADAINTSFGSFASFKERFSKVALNLFGSGWAWVIEHHGRLTIVTTANQDSPLARGRSPLFGLDLWEHAYYLLYQNRRADYVNAWWNVVNWPAINERLAHEMAGVVAH
jgi:Fe-Mn family superoxide dismutase